jgi:hypothetical protein
MCSKSREVSSSDVRDLEQRGPNRLTQPVAHSVESNPVCLSYRRALRRSRRCFLQLRASVVRLRAQDCRDSRLQVDLLR